MVISVASAAEDLTAPPPAAIASAPAVAAAPDAAPPAALPVDDPLTVSGVTVDKTDKNAVVARDAAIADARRQALQKLAARNLSADDLKNFKLPDDQTIAALVRDFEIANEQLSATRYVATFTVRFREDVRNYIAVKSAAEQAAASPEKPESPPAALPAPAQKGQRAVLVLPYYETIAGKKLLWEDNNPWMSAWQATPPKAEGVSILVPLGDISDVATGPTDAVWSGNLAGVEKLRANYNADEVILAVANKSGPSLAIDLYSYKDAHLAHLPSLSPYAGPGGEPEMMKQGEAAVAVWLAQDAVAAAAPKLEAAAKKAPAPAPAPAKSKLTLDAEMNFTGFAQWVDAQKRLASLTPPVTMEIKTISSSTASFSLKFDGTMETLKTALAARGIAISPPVTEVGEAVLGSARPTQRAVYGLQLVN